MMLLQKLRNLLLEIQLDFLWHQWGQLGVSAYVQDEKKYIIDPEALLLYTLYIGRFDSRLYDEVIDWCYQNGNFLSIPRIKSLERKNSFTVKKQLSALAELLSHKSRTAKWNKLSIHNSKEVIHTENLFFLKNGIPLPVLKDHDNLFKEHGLIRSPLKIRNNSHPFSPENPASAMLTLRSFMGISVRSDIVANLFNQSEKHPSQIARELGYYQKTVQDTLIDMSASRLIYRRNDKREKYYSLSKDVYPLLNNVNLQLLPWHHLFDSIVQLWGIINTQSVSNNIHMKVSECFNSQKSKLTSIGLPIELLQKDSLSDDDIIAVFRFLLDFNIENVTML